MISWGEGKGIADAHGSQAFASMETAFIGKGSVSEGVLGEIIIGNLRKLGYDTEIVAIDESFGSLSNVGLYKTIFALFCVAHYRLH